MLAMEDAGKVYGRTPLAKVRKLKARLDTLRQRLYPILSTWPQHKVTKDDNVLGFAYLDLLRDGLDMLEDQLEQAERRKPKVHASGHRSR
jgi:hypothetical protein